MPAADDLFRPTSGTEQAVAEQRPRRVHARLDPWEPPGVHPFVAALADDRGHGAVHDRDPRHVGDHEASLRAVEESSECGDGGFEDPSGSYRAAPLENRCADEPGGVYQ
jgi:hypothetical protein